ncbi:MAG: fluoride ion transporter CrcB, partial [Rhodocyclaceae bacterium]
FFALRPEIPPEARLFVITGFLGGLTTFSSVSAEVVPLINTGRYGWVFGAAPLHLGGSLSMTVHSWRS